MKTLLSLLLLVLGINIANSQIGINGCTYTPMPQDYSYMYKYLDYSFPDPPFDYTESYSTDNLKSKDDYTVDALCLDDEKIVSLKVTIYTYQSGNRHYDCYAVKDYDGWNILDERVNIGKLQDVYNEIDDKDTKKLILDLMDIGNWITIINNKIYILE